MTRHGPVRRAAANIVTTPLIRLHGSPGRVESEPAPRAFLPQVKLAVILILFNQMWSCWTGRTSTPLQVVLDEGDRGRFTWKSLIEILLAPPVSATVRIVTNNR